MIKSGRSEHKSFNVFEMGQEGEKFTIDCLYKIMYELSIDAKMYNLE